MIAMLQRLSRRHTSAVQQAKEGSPFLRGDPQYTGRMGTPGTPFYRENGDPGSPFSRDPQNFMTPAECKFSLGRQLINIHIYCSRPRLFSRVTSVSVYP